MDRKTSSLSILNGKNISNGMIVEQALIDLLIEKGVFSRQEIRTKIEEIRKEVAKRDPYGSVY